MTRARIKTPPSWLWPFLAWSGVALALSWFWGDELVRVHGWAMNQWFMDLPYLVRLIVRQAHWVFYLGFGILFLVEYRRGRKKEASAAILYLIANLLIAFLLVKLLKESLGRPRPFMESHGSLAWRPFALDTYFESLPSGHTTDAFVGAGLVGRLYSSPWIRWSSLGIALLVGVSRVALAKHYPSDVVLGMMIGYLGGIWLARLWQSGGLTRVLRAGARLAAGCVLIALGAWAASSGPAPEAVWSEAHGAPASPSPLLLPGQALGQPLDLPTPRLSYLSLRFATYREKPDGRLELLLLRGREIPQEEAALARRELARKAIPARELIDNAPLRWDLEPLRLSPGEGLYLVVGRAPGLGAEKGVSVWLGSGRDWKSGPAQVLFTEARGLLQAREAQGHISLELGYDREDSLLARWQETERGLQLTWLAQLGILLLALWLPLPRMKRRRD